jgi:hypothetical protein
MWRRPFLLGMLCGTLMTAGLVTLVQSLATPGTTARPTAATPRVPPVAVQVTNSPDLVPQAVPQPLPPGWYGYEFNGQMVYEMPLASHNVSPTSTD